jgi:phytoene dehydrogenase-like protein
VDHFDAVVVGAGPNGLAAALELSRAGRRVLVVEAAAVIGGGTRTEELTLPGFRHDVCAAIHPLGAASPFFRSAGIGDWIHPEIPLSHPLDGGGAGVLFAGLERTIDALGVDGARYRRLVGPLVPSADQLVEAVLGPLTVPPSHPVTLARFGLPGLAPAATMARGLRTDEGRALLAGIAAHAIAPFSTPLTGAVAVLFSVVAHAYGWPLQRGGSQGIATQMADEILARGGILETDRTVGSLDEIPDAPIILLDVMPDAARRIGSARLGVRAPRRMSRWRTGPGVFKVDWALDRPVPWIDEWSPKAGTVHVGGRYEEVAAAEGAVHEGRHPDRPFVIVTQQSLFDDTRAPAGRHTLWGYCHVPSGSTEDMTERIEAQIERFAPGFSNSILARHTMGPADYANHNPNYVDGDIAGGAFRVRTALQFGASRPYRIGKGLYLCSSATAPGAGVHGMCGYHAARAAMRDTRPPGG